MSELPETLAYTAEHEWVAVGEPATVGITAHAVEELGDIVFVELPGVGDSVTAGEPCGEIESTKAVSELYAPITGEIVEVNEAVVTAPEKVGQDPYGEGWLFRIKGDNAETVLLDAAGYRALITT